MLQVKTLIQQHIVKQHGQNNIHFIDGFPIAVCQYARAYRHKTFKYEGSSDLSEYCFKRCIDLQTPLRKNMPENRPISVINRGKNARGDIETVIGQLSGRFNMQKVRARDLWHLSHRFMRKILAYNFCFVINKQLGNPPF